MIVVGLVFYLIFFIVIGVVAVLVIRWAITLFNKMVGIGSSGGFAAAAEVVRLPTPTEVKARVTNGEITQEEADLILEDLVVPPHPPAPANSGGATAVVFAIAGAAVLGGVLAFAIAIVWAILDAKFGTGQL